MIIAAGEICILIDINFEAKVVKIKARITPITPPTKLNIRDSTKNWRKISLPLAPKAMRIPISRIRSVTDTNIIFIMPIPPTNNETEAIPPKKSVNVCVDSAIMLANSA